MPHGCVLFVRTKTQATGNTMKQWNERLLTTLEVAEMWGVTPNHVRAQKDLQPLDLGTSRKRYLRFPESEVKRYIAAKLKEREMKQRELEASK